MRSTQDLQYTRIMARCGPQHERLECFVTPVRAPHAVSPAASELYSEINHAMSCSAPQCCNIVYFHIQWIARTPVRLHVHGLQRIDCFTKLEVIVCKLHTIHQLRSHPVLYVILHLQWRWLQYRHPIRSIFFSALFMKLLINGSSAVVSKL